MDDNPMTDTQPLPFPPPALSLILSDMIHSLDQAALMAKQIPTTIDPNHLHQIYSSLHQAHHHLFSFLSITHPPEQSGTAADGGDEPMQVGDEPMQVGDEVEENSKGIDQVDMVEERLRDCFIKNKRPKRRLSPSVAAEEEKRFSDDGFRGGGDVYDPYVSKLRALELVYQFHG